MKHFLFILLLVLTACNPAPDEYTTGDAPPNADETIETIRDALGEDFGHRAVTVNWSSTVIVHDGKRKYGWSTSCQNIWVYWEPGMAVADTALVHEIAHCYAGDIGQSFSTSLNDSHADEYLWGAGGLVDYINNTLRPRVPNGVDIAGTFVEDDESHYRPRCPKDQH